MSHFHFQDEEALKAQRISDEEASRIVALWADQQREQEQRAVQPTVQAMAEGLDIPPEEVVRLLGEVRAREMALQALQAQQAAQTRHARRRTRARLIAMAAAVVVAVLLALILATPQNSSPAVPVGVAGPGATYEKHADGSVILNTPQGHYEYRADGGLSIRTPQGAYEKRADGSIEIRGPGGYLIHRADGSEERAGTPPTITPPTPPPGVTLPALP